MRFIGKTAVVTGAARGIGRSVALKLAMEGARVVAIDVNSEELSRLKGELAEYTNEALCFECDISNEARVNEIALEVFEKFKRVDILVNNAAVWRLHCTFKRFPQKRGNNILTSTSMEQCILPRLSSVTW